MGKWVEIAFRSGKSKAAFDRREGNVGGRGERKSKHPNKKGKRKIDRTQWQVHFHVKGEKKRRWKGTPLGKGEQNSGEGKAPEKREIGAR